MTPQSISQGVDDRALEGLIGELERQAIAYLDASNARKETATRRRAFAHRYDGVVDAILIVQRLALSRKIKEEDGSSQSQTSVATGQGEAGDTGGWRPIETAPDSETVLVAGGDAIYPVTASWSGLSDEPWCIDGQENVHEEIGWPTHWKPLPAAPVQTLQPRSEGEG